MRRHHPGVPLGTQVLGWTAFQAAERAVVSEPRTGSALDAHAPHLSTVRSVRATPDGRARRRVRGWAARRPRIVLPARTAGR
jgi:hypothetical protein